MDWIIQKLMENDTIVASGLTFMLSVIGAKKVIGEKLNSVFSITRETLEAVAVLSRALKPDEDGKIRIDKAELKEIQKELGDLKKALGGILAVK